MLTLSLVVDLHVCFYGGIFGEVDMRKFGGVQSHLDSSGLVSFFLAKGKQVHRFTV